MRHHIIKKKQKKKSRNKTCFHSEKKLEKHFFPLLLLPLLFSLLHFSLQFSIPCSVFTSTFSPTCLHCFYFLPLVLLFFCFLFSFLIHSFFFISSSLSPFTWCLLHCFFLFSILLLLSPHLSIMSFISSFDSPVHHRTQTTTTSKPLPSPSAAPVSPVQWTHPGCITLKHLQRELQASKAKVISTPSHHLFPQQLHVSLPLSLPGRPPHH